MKKQQEHHRFKSSITAEHLAHVFSWGFFWSLIKSNKFNFYLIGACWALLYLPHLRINPKWYGDETLIHHTARNLIHGIPSNFALWNTFWHPHYPYQSIYTFICGLFSFFTSGDIVGSRFFNALLALACAFSFFFLGKRSFGSSGALFATLMFLTYEQSIIHFRMSYAHNGAALGNLLLTLYLLRPSELKTDLKGGLGLALSAGSHPLFIHSAVAAFFLRITRPKSWIPLFLPTGLYLMVSIGLLYWRFGPWLAEDLKHLSDSFANRGGQDASSLLEALSNLLQFATQDWYHLSAVIGLFLCLNRRFYAAGLMGLWVLLMLVKNRANLIVFYYQAVVILPVLALGWARWFGIFQATSQKFFGNSRWAATLWILPTLLFLMNLPSSWNNHLTPRNQYWVTQDTKEVESCAAWINERTTPDDFVAANPNIAWLLKARAAPYLQIITWYGETTQGYENGNKRERFRYDCSLEKARYAIIGDIDQRWTFGEPNVNHLVELLQSHQWPVVWKGAYYLVLANPSLPK